MNSSSDPEDSSSEEVVDDTPPTVDPACVDPGVDGSDGGAVILAKYGSDPEDPVPDDSNDCVLFLFFSEEKEGFLFFLGEAALSVETMVVVEAKTESFVEAPSIVDPPSSVGVTVSFPIPLPTFGIASRFMT